jgi:hypothetical protein
VAREGKPAVSQALFSANGSGRTLFERNSTLEHKKNTLRSFSLSEGEEKACIPSSEHLSSFFEPLPLRSTQRSQFNLLRHFCVIFTQIVPQSPKRNTPHSYFSYAHQFFHIFAYTFPNCISTLPLVLFRLNQETAQENGFRQTQFGEIRIKP